MRKYILIVLILVVVSLVAYYFWPEKKLSSDTKITKIVVVKSQRKMMVYSGEQLLKEYTISLGKKPSGDKIFEGDNRTPEGNYIIDSKNPNSVCYKNLGVSYPDKTDIDKAAQFGKPPGGDIKIHGLPNGQAYIGKLHRFRDWTNGCIAVTNSEIDELYEAVDIGTPIIINP